MLLLTLTNGKGAGVFSTITKENVMSAVETEGGFEIFVAEHKTMQSRTAPCSRLSRLSST